MKALSIGGLMFAIAAISTASEVVDDETLIRAEIDAYLVAWNAGDADALASFYDEDGDRVNNRGEVFRGPAAIREHYEKVFAIAPPAGAERRLAYHQVDVRVVSADAAVVDILFEVTGIRAEIDSAVRARNTVFMIKRDGRWMRVAHRNSLPTTPACLKRCSVEGLLPEQGLP